jgi:hypothetical protein
MFSPGGLLSSVPSYGIFYRGDEMGKVPTSPFSSIVEVSDSDGDIGEEYFPPVAREWLKPDPLTSQS